MILQNTFNTVSAHLLAQNARSLADYNLTQGCAYRGENGLKCAIGALIKDEFYLPKLEGLMVAATQTTQAVLKSLKLEQQGTDLVAKDGETVDCLLFLELLHDLQLIHDNVDPCLWQEYLIGTATRFNLEFAQGEQLAKQI